MAQLSSTRTHGIGCGSSSDGRKTKPRGRLTSPIRPSVEPIPICAIDQKSATISEIQRSQRSQAGRGRARAPHRPQLRPQRLDEPEQRRALVADLVHERRRDAVADHPLARDPDERDRVVAAAGQPGPGPADRAAEPAVQRADDRRPVEEPARQEQRLGGRDVEAGQQHPVVVLAALGDHLGEQVELRQRVLEAQPQHPEPALLLGRRRGRARAAQPAQERLRPPVHLAPAGDQVLLDPRQRGRATAPPPRRWSPGARTAGPTRAGSAARGSPAPGARSRTSRRASTQTPSRMILPARRIQRPSGP